MTEAIAVALLALLGNVLVSWFANRKSTALIIYRVDQLETKVNKHNQVIERTYKLEAEYENLHQEVERLESYHNQN